MNFGMRYRASTIIINIHFSLYQLNLLMDNSWRIGRRAERHSDNVLHRFCPCMWAVQRLCLLQCLCLGCFCLRSPFFSFKFLGYFYLWPLCSNVLSFFLWFHCDDIIAAIPFLLRETIIVTLTLTLSLSFSAVVMHVSGVDTDSISLRKKQIWQLQFASLKLFKFLKYYSWIFIILRSYSHTDALQNGIINNLFFSDSLQATAIEIN